jgi:hypothetical protein
MSNFVDKCNYSDRGPDQNKKTTANNRRYWYNNRSREVLNHHRISYIYVIPAFVNEMRCNWVTGCPCSESIIRISYFISNNCQSNCLKTWQIRNVRQQHTEKDRLYITKWFYSSCSWSSNITLFDINHFEISILFPLAHI